MPFVIDASMAAAWLLPGGYSEVAEAVIARIETQCSVPSLFFFEIRNILVMSERRGRLSAGGALVNMKRIRRLPLDDAEGMGANTLRALPPISPIFRLRRWPQRSNPCRGRRRRHFS